MVRKCGVWMFAVVAIPAVLVLGGCETVKGTARGMYLTVEGAATGLAKDTTGNCGTLQRIDRWMRENMW